MAKRPTEKLSVGDIVMIRDPNDSAFRCLGEVESLGPPIKVAVVNIRTYERQQIEKSDDLTGLNWNSLRKKAVNLGVKASGKREDIEAAIKREVVKSRGIDESQHSFELEQFVWVKSGGGRRHGQIIQINPSIVVKLTGSGEELPCSPSELESAE